jgi:hypothetical protein
MRAIKLRAAAPKTNVKKAAVNATARVKAGMRQAPNKAKLRSIPKNLLKDPRFTKMWVKIHMNLKPNAGETVYNVESRARNMARNIIRTRLNKGQTPFSVLAREEAQECEPEG